MRVLSAVQPTGRIHIGNYLGAIKQWLDLQKKNECIFIIVDLHALTEPYDPKSFQNLILDLAATYLAAGLDPKKCLLFIQSQVPEHTELMWLLNTITPVGDLLRMTQFKEKSEKFKKLLNAGLLNYPILMAADILLYKTQLVPVGEDQLQHLELTRTIARKFNKTFGKTFPEPKAILSETGANPEGKQVSYGARILSLQEPLKKMSKSDGPETRIDLDDLPNAIRQKIKTAVTDSGREVKYDLKNKPAISNLLTIYSLFSRKSIPELEKKYKNRGYAEFKKDLAEVIIKNLEPLQQKRQVLLKKPAQLRKILNDGAKRAKKIAQKNLKEIKTKMGLL